MPYPKDTEKKARLIRDCEVWSANHAFTEALNALCRARAHIGRAKGITKGQQKKLFRRIERVKSVLTDIRFAVPDYSVWGDL